MLNSPLSGSERSPPLLVAVEADLMRHRGGPLRQDREVVLVTAPNREAEQLEKWVTDWLTARVPEPDRDCRPHRLTSRRVEAARSVEP